MAINFPVIRTILYGVLATLSFIVLALSAARLHYTTHLPSDSLYEGGKRFHDPVVAELLFTSLISMVWSVYIADVIIERREHRILTTVGSEVAGLLLLFIFWLAGAASSSRMWGGMKGCAYHACSVLSALVAFSWLSWLVLSALLAIAVLFGIANKAWANPLHARYDPHASVYIEDTGSRTSGVLRGIFAHSEGKQSAV